MSRPIKQGLDYFPMDVETDDKIDLIEAKHGICGFGVIVRLWQRIYKEGYFINWNEESLLLFSRRINVDRNEVTAIINDGLCYDIFNNELYSKYKILTSAGIQRRYLFSILRRKKVNLYRNFIIVDINSINVDINWINDDISTQRKGKDRKGKDSIVQKTKIVIDDNFYYQVYTKEHQKKFTESELDNFYRYCCENINGLARFQSPDFDLENTLNEYFQKEQKPPALQDFIDRIIAEFVEVHGDYKVTNKRKERDMAGKLLAIFKEDHPDLDSEGMLLELRSFFQKCITIADPWLKTRMSIPIMVSCYNQINSELKNGGKQQKGVTSTELAEIVTKHFASE